MKPIKIQISIVLIILFAVLFSSVLVHLSWEKTSKLNTDNMVKRLNIEIMSKVKSEVNNFFDEAEKTENIIKEIFTNDVVNFDSISEKQKFYLILLMNNKNFSWITFGWKNGDFLGVQREGEDKINLVIRKWNEEKQISIETKTFYRIENNNLKKISIHESETDYKSTDRSWYKAVQGLRKNNWTGVYIFNTTKRPGINVSVPYEKDKKLIGVVSIAMELDNISHFLSNIDIGENGTVFIMNQWGELVAFPNPNQIFNLSDKNGEFKLRKISESNNKYLKIANIIYKDQNFMKNDKIRTIKHKTYEKTDVTFITDLKLKTKKNYYVTFENIDKLDWIIGTVIPEDNFLLEVKENRKRLSVFIIIFVILILTLNMSFSRRLIVRPIHKITKQIEHIENFELDKIENVNSNVFEINLLASAIFNMTKGLSSFEKYVPTSLVRKLIKQGKQAILGGDSRQLTIFFADIASFTTSFEDYGEELIPLLNEYFEEMSQIITNNNGTIDKYIGDAIMSFWNAPEIDEDHSINACRSALMCQHHLRTLRLKWKRENKPQLFCRIGLNTGKITVGNIGSKERMNYTVIGDPVNTASRIENLNKVYGTEILIGEETYKQAKDLIIARKIDKVKVYGKNKSTEIYELLSMVDSVSTGEKYKWVMDYEKGLELYEKREFKKAISEFENVLLNKENDKASQVLIKRCNYYIENPPEKDWNSTKIMKKK